MMVIPGDAKKHDGKERWVEGIWLGTREESQEVIIGTDKGIVKGRTIRRFGKDGGKME